MKYILTIIPGLYGGGAEKIAADLSFKLSENYNHTILLYNKSENKYSYSGKLIELNLPKKNNLLARIIKQLGIIKKIIVLKKEINPKITISHMLMANMLNILTKKQDITVCFIHGEWSVKTGKGYFLDYFVKNIYKRADIVVSVSHHIKNVFDSYYNIKLPHEVIQIGINTKLVLKKANEKSIVELPEKYIVYVAGFRPVKNHVLLIKQLESYLKKTDIHLVLLGDGPLRSDIESILDSLDLTNKVHLIGNQKNPYPIIKNASLSLMVSSSESFSLVVVESMALGIPVIATDCGGPREIIDPDWNIEKEIPYQTDYGILIQKLEYWKKDELVIHIEKVIKDRALWSSLSEMGIKRAENFDISNTEKNLETLLKRLLN